MLAAACRLEQLFYSTWNLLHHKLLLAVPIGGFANAKVIGVICVQQLQNGAYFKMLKAIEPD